MKTISSLLLAFAFLSAGNALVNADSTKTGSGSITFAEGNDNGSATHGKNLPATGEANSALIAAIGGIIVIVGVGTGIAIKKHRK